MGNIYELKEGETYYIITNEYRYYVNSAQLLVDTINTKPTEIPTETPTEIPVLVGDVNNDGNINAEDALLVLKHAAKIELIAEDNFELADVIEDGVINSVDALKILKIAAKISD